MDAAQTEKLKALALAMPGAPWKAQHPYARPRGWEVADSSGLHQICENVTADIADYIAAANPATVLDLIADNERLRAEAERYRYLRSHRVVGQDDRTTPWVVRLDPAQRIPTMIRCAEGDLDRAIDAAIEAHTKAREGA